MPSLLDRIDRVPVGSLKLHPQNARKGDIPVITQSLSVNQQFQPLVVQTSTRYVLSGNHRGQSHLRRSVVVGAPERTPRSRRNRVRPGRRRRSTETPRGTRVQT